MTEPNRVRVHLDDDYYCGETYSECTHKSDWAGNIHARDCFQVPRDQFERWEAASAAYVAMQQEIGQLIAAKRSVSSRGDGGDRT